MVLNYITDGTRLVIESASALDSEVFRHCDLHTFDIVAVPKCFHKRVSEAEDQHAANRPLSKIVIDAEDCCLVEDSMQHLVEFPRRNQVTSEGFFNNYASILVTA